MSLVDLNQNFARIYRTLEQELKKTNIAKKMGFTSTAQLSNVLEKDGSLSTKAIVKLVDELKVNPTYLFLGKGEMFLVDGESEIERLRAENRKLLHNHSEAVKTVAMLNEEIGTLRKRYDDLVDITSKAIKYYESQKPDAGVENISESDVNEE